MPGISELTRQEEATSHIARIHKFRDSVALYLKSGRTEYLSPKEAISLAKELTRCAKQAEYKATRILEGGRVEND